MTAVVHHIEMCVKDGNKTLECLQKFGLYLHARRSTPFCYQLAAKVGNAIFLITERRKSSTSLNDIANAKNRLEPFTVFCCENSSLHEVDSVFNIAFQVKNVEGITNKIAANGGDIIQKPTKIRDEFGQVVYSIVKSCCGNVVHTLINKDDYSGLFLPGYKNVCLSEADCEVLDEWDKRLTHVDHVTLACYTGSSQNVISWYETCFGMQRFAISREDDDDEGLILEDGVGLRLKAMEFWRCAETGLFCPSPSKNRDRHPSGLMLVVVESIPGQVNCNIENFLREHEKSGVEHIALNTTFMTETVAEMSRRGVSFRKLPKAYFNEASKRQQILDIGQDVECLKRLGILLDCEVDPEDEDSKKPKYLMQIFSHPIFNRKTFFIEVIERCGARGLGAGNIVALVRSIREEKM